MQSRFSDTKKKSERFPTEQCCHRIAILIVGFRNPNDIKQCLAALSLAKPEPSFDVFICENGGSLGFQQLIDELTGLQGPCVKLLADLTPSICRTSEKLLKVESLALRGRDSRVWIACAKENLGYAGGINVWLERLMHVAGWEGVWILNPDTEPDPECFGRAG